MINDLMLWAENKITSWYILDGYICSVFVFNLSKEAVKKHLCAYIEDMLVRQEVLTKCSSFVSYLLAFPGEFVCLSPKIALEMCYSGS